jgi:myosin heavy subunit
MIPTIVQRLLAVAAVMAIVVLFYQVRSVQMERELLKTKAADQTRRADSLATELSESGLEKGVLRSENIQQKLEIERANAVLASILANMDEISRREAAAKSLMQQQRSERGARLISAGDYRKIDHEINSYLEAMYTTLNASRRRVDELQGELENAFDTNEQLRSFVTNLRRMVETQEKTIENLQKEKAELQEQLTMYEEENRQLRKAWVVVGTMEELRKRNIVRKPMLRPLEILPFDSTRFQPFDIAKNTLSFGDRPLKDVNVLSVHKKHPDFYGLSADGKSLVIKDPAQFWRISKFLIIEVQ